jgi:hypothetical protein
MKRTLSAVSIVVMAGVACKGGAKTPDTPGMVDVPTLGLTIHLLSTKATVEESAIYHDKGVDIHSRAYQDDIHVNVSSSMPTPEEETKPSDPKAERDFKVEKLADGFVVTFVKTYGTVGDRFMVQSYRTIAGKTVSCSGNGTTPERQQAVVDACKSIAAK